MFKNIFLLTLLFGCATKPTSYNKGYGDRQLEDIKVSSFKANNVTTPKKARLFAEFRAIENCRTEGKNTNILDILDKTVSKEIVRSSSDGFGPSYYGGMYPFYGRHSSFGLSAGFNTMSSRSWSETQVYPYVEVFYTCENEIQRPLLDFKEIPASEMKHLVKDIKGGVQVEKILTASPNHNSFEEGDIILKVNNKRIERVYELVGTFRINTPKAKVLILREGERITLELKSQNVTANVKNAENTIIKMACKAKDKEIKKRPLCKST